MILRGGKPPMNIGRIPIENSLLGSPRTSLMVQFIHGGFCFLGNDFLLLIILAIQLNETLSLFLLMSLNDLQQFPFILLHQIQFKLVQLLYRFANMYFILLKDLKGFKAIFLLLIDYTM